MIAFFVFAAIGITIVCWVILVNQISCLAFQTGFSQKQKGERIMTFKTYKSKSTIEDEIRDKFKIRNEFVKFLREKI